MKELKLDDQGLQSAVAIVESIKENEEYKYLGSYRMKIDGGKVFRYDIANNKLTPAEYELIDTLDLNKKTTAKHKLSIKPDSVYIEALNLKNAFKRLMKRKIMFISPKKNT